MNPLTSLRLQLRDRFIKFYTDDLVRISRKRRAKQLLSLKLNHLKPLSSAQKHEILAFWKPFRDISSEMRWFEFYHSTCENLSQLKHYIPESVYYTQIDTFFTLPRRAEEIDDKNLYDLFFPDLKRPATIVRKSNGVLLDADYRIIDTQQAIQLCKQQGTVISKEARNSAGGYGLRFFDFPSCTDSELADWLRSCGDVNVQEVIHQHECLNQLYDKSINSLRIMSLILDGEVHILSSVLRMGRDGSRVDNASSGGLACGIRQDGTLREYAYDKTGKRYTRHPQGAEFNGHHIVGYDKCCELISRNAGKMSSASKLVSWDFAIDPQGEPILIEVNLSYGGVTIHQMCNGPIFGDLTEDILSRVYHSKTNK